MVAWSLSGLVTFGVFWCPSGWLWPLFGGLVFGGGVGVLVVAAAKEPPCKQTWQRLYLHFAVLGRPGKTSPYLFCMIAGIRDKSSLFQLPSRSAFLLLYHRRVVREVVVIVVACGSSYIR
jgi:hypothetical protein